MDSFEKDLKVLILTNHMENIAGSEIVALEVAESFQKYGCNVKIYANQIGLPMADIVRDSGIELDDSDQYPNPFDFDIIWSQHHVIPLLISTNIESKNDRPYFIFAHLSPYEPLETVGLYTEHIFADKILVNSHETKERLESLGVETDKIEIFYNASPSSFQSASKVNLLKNSGYFDCTSYGTYIQDNIYLTKGTYTIRMQSRKTDNQDAFLILYNETFTTEYTRLINTYTSYDGFNYITFTIQETKNYRLIAYTNGLALPNVHFYIQFY